jgi:hypothetical protein
MMDQGYKAVSDPGVGASKGIKLESSKMQFRTWIDYRDTIETPGGEAAST